MHAGLIHEIPTPFNLHDTAGRIRACIGSVCCGTEVFFLLFMFYLYIFITSFYLDMPRHQTVFDYYRSPFT